MKKKMTYEPPVVKNYRVTMEGVIASSVPRRISVGVECMEDVMLGDDGNGNSDILLNF